MGSGRALILHPYLKSAGNGRTPEARLDEAAGLAEAIQLDVTGKIAVPVTKPQPSTLLGSGKVNELAELIAEQMAH